MIILVRRFLVLAVLLLAGLAASTSAAGFTLQLVGEGKTFSRFQRGRLLEFLGEAEYLLPPALKNALRDPIFVTFSPWDRDDSLPVPTCDGTPDRRENRIYGKISSRGIELNSLFIQEIMRGRGAARAYPCGHKDLYTLAQATLLHEIGHLYDNSSRHGMVSGDWLYRKITGWVHRRHLSHLFFAHLEPDNQVASRSPNLNEFKSPEEHFAINFEYFILDPAYACQRPTEYDFFVDHFKGFMPFKNLDCKVNTAAFLQFLNSASSVGSRVDLDPTRIYEVHALLATGGKTLGESWGHFMFRFIGCKPGREVGPGCLQDIAFHTVIDFRFKQPGATYSPWKTLTGAYASQAFLYSFLDVTKEYNTKFRDLISLPIKMTEAEKKRFVYKFLEDYWDYRGKYYLVKNNCATLAAKLLKVAFGDEKFRSLRPLTPKQMQSDLTRFNLVDRNLVQSIYVAIERQNLLHEQVLEKIKGNLLLADEKFQTDELKSLKAQGYYFPSALDTLELAFATIKAEALQNGISFSWKTVDAYLANSDVTERLAVFNQLATRLDATVVDRNENSLTANQIKVKNRRVYAGFYSLENIILVQYQAAMEGKVFRTL
jgi:hypothetical protein